MAAAGGGVGDSELRLLGKSSSPWVFRVRVALGLRGLSYEYIEEDLGNKSELLLRSNPVHKKVPVLIHGGRPVCESLVILQYVDEIWRGTGPPLLPSDPYDRATARFWAAYVDDKFFPAFSALFRSRTDEQRAEALQNALLVAETLERAFTECSRGKAFFGGDAVGLVDVTLGSHPIWIRAVDQTAGTNLLDGARFPDLAAWAERFMALGAVNEVVPDAGKLLEQYRASRAKWTAAADSS
ncbi:putative glutathione S-transferase GSTU6 [Zea mays]|uniref:glutathione transferase n=2 Tax=Zea mays TaxID=4577 RepID=B6U9Z8_MAIZE|nr:glutathione S-transferase GSTU6 [Zea mays]ACG46181.1 glutathione S-transferase GSTU6 [Zea mays]ONM39030.1 Glutathione S-transferase GSTU6 [Zea mays]PWZ31819.1 putative glutathione S-transferase GSTU6 [Zea mays]|eukprot:NP_001152168.1 glutathione S-transferase GSTU6 [Zea mays]